MAERSVFSFIPNSMQTNGTEFLNLIPSLCAFVLSAKGDLMTYEIKYMVNGCGKKIQSTRTIVVIKDGVVIDEVRTQEELDSFRRKYESGNNKESL